MEHAGPTSPWAVRDAVFIYLGALAATFVALIAAAAAGLVDIDALADPDTTGDQLPRLILISAISQYAAMLLGLKLLSDRKGTGDFRRDFHLRVSSSDWLFLLYGAGLLVASSIVLTGVFELLGIDAPTQEVVEAARLTESVLEKAAIVLAIAIFAPILEEMLFRGVLLDALKLRMALSPAVWVTGIAFGLVHLTDPATLALVPALIFLGVVLGFVRERGGGSLSRPILMHMGFNSVTAAALWFAL